MDNIDPEVRARIERETIERLISETSVDLNHAQRLGHGGAVTDLRNQMNWLSRKLRAQQPSDQHATQHAMQTQGVEGE